MLALCSSTLPARNLYKRNSTCPKQIYLAPRIGIIAPLSMGRASDEIGFSDVAAPGFSGAIEGMWMQSEMIGLGVEIGYSHNPYKEAFWNNLSFRGTFDASYASVSAMALGRIIAGVKRVKPMIGIGVGGALIHNTMDFQSKFKESSDDESVKYKTNDIYPCLAFDTGIFYKVRRGTMLSVTIRLGIIPNLKEETKYSIDPYTFEEKSFKVNQHGNQNHILVSVGLHSGLRKRYRR
ncbi:MAG: hypothetical protein HUJ96_05385 [Marinilabiliaceae bacterium]|nr:hypothetical protein [Marinilabiliaceae bacterium]